MYQLLTIILELSSVLLLRKNDYHVVVSITVHSSRAPRGGYLGESTHPIDDQQCSLLNPILFCILHFSLSRSVFVVEGEKRGQRFIYLYKINL